MALAIGMEKMLVTWQPSRDTPDATHCSKLHSFTNDASCSSTMVPAVSFHILLGSRASKVFDARAWSDGVSLLTEVDDDDDDDEEDDDDSNSLSAVVVLAFDDDGAAVDCRFSMSSAIPPQSTLERSYPSCVNSISTCTRLSLTIVALSCFAALPKRNGHTVARSSPRLLV